MAMILRAFGRLSRRFTSPAAECRDWAALPHDALLTIFSKLQQADILRGAGLVCASWRRVAVGEPVLWRHIDLPADEHKSNKEEDAQAGWQAMARAAVDRSAGQCESFRGRADFNLLVYLADNAPTLRSLHVTTWLAAVVKDTWLTAVVKDYGEEDDDDKSFVIGVIKKLPLLERFVLSRGYIEKPVLPALLEYCPHLELLDADGCSISAAIGYKLRARLQSRIRDLRLPETSGGCGCCSWHVQSYAYADEHDE